MAARGVKGRARAPRPFRLFEHTADLGLEARGQTREELFANAARGLTSAMCDLRQVRPRRAMRLEASCDEADDAALLVTFLDEVLYQSSVHHLLLCDFRVTFPDEGRVIASARGEEVSPRHAIAREVKAVTYHQALVTRTPGGFRAQVILDI